MNNLNKVLLSGFVGLALIAAANSAVAKDRVSASVSTEDTVLDYNERMHLVFMREEEKLARDVYLALGTMYPDSVIFGKIDDSEQRHTTAVKAMIENYG
ncbi:MAG: DUF2202 domain-containing protein, partial [Gammaproteobacteria bacterium]